jgi:hypothetical protein
MGGAYVRDTPKTALTTAVTGTGLARTNTDRPDR